MRAITSVDCLTFFEIIFSSSAKDEAIMPQSDDPTIPVTMPIHTKPNFPEKSARNKTIIFS